MIPRLLSYLYHLAFCAAVGFIVSWCATEMGHPVPWLPVAILFWLIDFLVYFLR